jgi:uncharacterized protein (TIRG00374 family)
MTRDEIVTELRDMDGPVPSDEGEALTTPAAGAEAPSDRPWYLNWKVWFGIAITVGSFWFTARGIPVNEVVEAMSKANLPVLLILSIPCYLLSTYVRGLRWRHFTNPIAEIPRASLFRAQAIGFMVNNLVPMRIGEFVRSWYLAREHGVSATAILGTVVIERVLDVVSVLILAALSLTWAGRGSDSMLAQATFLLLPVAFVPLIGLVILKTFPEQLIGLVRWVTQPLPHKVGETLENLLRSFSKGLGSLSRGPHLFWILVHTLVIWLVLSTIPMLAGIWAFGLDFGGPTETLMISWILLAAVGVAVAIPAAPGFFGTYQLAFSLALERFGVEPATALALGLLVWFIFWVTLVLLGLYVIRSQHMSLGELTHQSGKDQDTESR